MPPDSASARFHGRLGDEALLAGHRAGIRSKPQRGAGEGGRCPRHLLPAGLQLERSHPSQPAPSAHLGETHPVPARTCLCFSPSSLPGGLAGFHVIFYFSCYDGQSTAGVL